LYDGSKRKNGLIAQKPAEKPILIAVADEALRERLGHLLAAHDPESSADDVESVLAAVDRHAGLRLLVLSETTQDSSTLSVLQGVKARRADLAVLVVSTCPTVEHATEAVRRGAEDFLPVPFSPDLLHKEVDRILEAAELRDRVNQLNRLVANRNGFERVISQSARMRPVLDSAIAASRSDTPVLIVGETGTGKELIARAIHGASNRATLPLMPINCAALPHDLVESELFGHRRGAFSGALRNHSGLFVAAHAARVMGHRGSPAPHPRQQATGGADARHLARYAVSQAARARHRSRTARSSDIAGFS
jgi:DNA-binding NtrC family response regulator